MSDTALSQILPADPSRVIVALSGGKASAWCAKWAFDHYPKDKVILYFNDVKWEHEDLYRFLNDLAHHFDHPIVYDSDGRSPEELFYDMHALGNNLMPFCSRMLKAERLQRYYQDGDLLVFGISDYEAERAVRLTDVYAGIAQKLGKRCSLVFPLIECRTTRQEIDQFLADAGIEQPLLYKLGFSHNNCSGGCVRSGKKGWAYLYKMLPDVYRERERVEREVREWLGKDVSILYNETLESFRKRIDSGKVSRIYDQDEEEERDQECMGICPAMF